VKGVKEVRETWKVKEGEKGEKEAKEAWCVKEVQDVKEERWQGGQRRTGVAG
jgi:hypothetical protein